MAGMQSGNRIRPDRSSLSIILVVAHPDDCPEDVIGALERQSGQGSFELVIVDARPEATCPKTSGCLQDVIFLTRPGQNMPRLKAEGLAAASGQTVAFLEPKGIPNENWVCEIERAFHHSNLAALGGCVEFAGAESAANLAAFLFEYSAFGRDDVERGNTTDLPGNNMVFRREALISSCAKILADHGLNKPFCQSNLERDGAEIHLSSDLCIRLHSMHQVQTLLTSRFQYARCFGGVRMAQAGRARRILMRIGAPAVPFIVMWRRLPSVRYLKVGSFRPDVILILVALCLFWALGEVTGYWFGRGRSCDHLR